MAKLEAIYKNVYWANICAGTSFQVTDSLQYASQGRFFQGAWGLKRERALILNQDPYFLDSLLWYTAIDIHDFRLTSNHNWLSAGLFLHGKP